MFLLRTGIQGWKIPLERDVFSRLQVFNIKQFGHAQVSKESK